MAEGVTVADPCGVAQGLQTAWPEPSTTVNEAGGPAAICQLSVAFWPGVMLLGDALKLSVTGTVTVTVAGPEAPPDPVAVREKVVVWPAPTEVGLAVNRVICGGAAWPTCT